MATERLDLAEGKRLLSEWRAEGDYLPIDRGLAKWFSSNADSLFAAAEDAERNKQGARFAQIVGEELVKRGWMNDVAVTGPELLDFVLSAFDAVEEAEKLRKALQHARSALRTVQPLHVEDGLALNNDSVIRYALRKIDAALTQPEPTPGAS